MDCAAGARNNARAIAVNCKLSGREMGASALTFLDSGAGRVVGSTPNLQLPTPKAIDRRAADVLIAEAAISADLERAVSADLQDSRPPWSCGSGKPMGVPRTVGFSIRRTGFPSRTTMPASAMTECHCRRRTVRLNRLPHAIGFYSRIPDPRSRIPSSAEPHGHGGRASQIRAGL